ncbi:hypothetical protein CPB83DRAFT_911041 [Crepidotus variabilis]|uniref:Uncharacterized protein n=1 Tax=Crepidotus variabilis TaxID=179855 RepID=A0A9P6E5J8_9AGAR|nr:hypothetical protein CPB83DRAFT_911041 [Crepidotus variabilis]
MKNDSDKPKTLDNRLLEIRPSRGSIRHPKLDKLLQDPKLIELVVPGTDTGTMNIQRATNIAGEVGEVGREEDVSGSADTPIPTLISLNHPFDHLFDQILAANPSQPTHRSQLLLAKHLPPTSRPAPLKNFSTLMNTSLGITYRTLVFGVRSSSLISSPPSVINLIFLCPQLNSSSLHPEDTLHSPLLRPPSSSSPLHLSPPLSVLLQTFVLHSKNLV